MNKISPKKLFNSKWTATSPINKEKHFLVVSVEVDESQLIVECVLQSVMSKRDVIIQWRDLKNTTLWSQGWR